jgi:hypothetical protein
VVSEGGRCVGRARTRLGGGRHKLRGRRARRALCGVRGEQSGRMEAV